jgi:hypothetical protein
MAAKALWTTESDVFYCRGGCALGRRGHSVTENIALVGIDQRLGKSNIRKATVH